MKRSWITPLLCGLVLGATALSFTGRLIAQGAGGGTPAAGSRAGTVDVIKVFNEYQRQVDLSGEIRQLQERLAAENQTRRTKLDETKAALEKLDPNDPVYPSKQNEFLQTQLEYKNWFDLKDAAITREVAVWTIKIYREITKAAEEVALQNGLDIVLYRDEFQPTSQDPNEIKQQIYARKVLYANPTIDVSAAVLERVNAVYKAQPKKPMLSVP